MLQTFWNLSRWAILGKAQNVDADGSFDTAGDLESRILGRNC